MSTDAVEKAERKRLKKEKKAAAAAAAAATGAGPSASTAEADPNPSTKEKKEKKKKKREEGSEAAPAPTGKKSKKAAPPAGPAPLAEVGDRELVAKRPPLVKALYSETAEVASQSDAEVAAWREARAIVVEGCSLRPITAFAQTGLSSTQLHAVRAFSAPSPIQAQCLPIALSGRDAVGIAATGSGKTLAFGLPALAHIAAQIGAGVVTGKKPIALVIAPTRELAIQISVVLEEAGQPCGISSVCVYGGVSKRDQVTALRKGAQIVVATPGRLEDLIQDNACRLDDVSYLVLDEADRMLDLGFEPHIRAIASKTRADRQTLMFSATWPNVIRKLASEFLSNPARVIIGSQDLAASHSVKQIVEVIDAPARDARLHALLQQYHGSRTNRVIVFVLYKKEATRVESLLQRKGWKAAAVHGDISQAQRSAAVDAFKAGTVPVLVATDVAARGLDIPDVEVVINYSFPLTTEDYVHRIGRTGRAGKKGLAHTMFVGANDKPRAGELINVLNEAKQEVPASLFQFGTSVKKKESKMYGAHFKDVDLTKKASKISFDSDDE
uniref:RNA helicase n=1 Tax=Auxenochlorella protothecoides TaxID=3075 RepID=A0A1D2AAX4_AUXPR